MDSISRKDPEREFPDLRDRAEADESLVVSRGGRPAAEIRPVAPPIRGPRAVGLAARLFVVPDDFDAPLPDDVLRAFEGR